MKRSGSFLKTATAAVLTAASFAVGAQSRDSLTIAYPVDVQSWDPTAVTFPAGQSIYKTVFDSPLAYSPDGKLVARLVRAWKWQDKQATRLEVTLRDDVRFHDGSRLTAEDLKFSFEERPHADKKLAIGALMADLKTVEIVSPTQAVLVYDKPTPAAPIYLAFLCGYILPKNYFQKVGEQGFLAHPIGAGPYRIVDYQRGSRLVLEAFDKYWGGAPKIRRVTFEFIPDPSARVAAIESGRADVAVQIPVRETLRLGREPGRVGKVYPYSEVYMIQIPSYVPVFQDENVRLAMHLAIDKQALSKAFYNGVAVPLSVMAPPNTPGFVPGYKFPYDPARAVALLAKSGRGPDKPVRFKLFSTNGTFPNDYEMARAIVGMWKKVGIDADVEEITVAKYLELNHAAKLTGAVLYSWANATGDPEDYIGRILDPRLRFSAWKDPALGKVIEGLLHQPDEAKRIQGYRELEREASEHTWTLPLLQAVTTIAYKSDLDVKLYEGGYILPAEYSFK